MAKRPCCSSLSSDSSSSNTLLPSHHQEEEMSIHSLLSSFLSISDSASLHSSFDKLLESTESDFGGQSLLVDRALELGHALLEAGKRSARKRATVHNSYSWPLPPDLTVKVFALLDTQSLCYVAATCSMFQKCALDPFCYANIDLTTVVPKVNNTVVSSMIQRAGKVLRSLKLGVIPGPMSSAGSEPLVYTIRNSFDASSFSWNDKKSRQGKESSFLTRSCLTALNGDTVAPGSLLRRLHLYNIERLDSTSLSAALSACPALLDLEIVGLHVELRQTLMSVSANCHLMQRLFFESSKTGRDDSLKSQTCVEFIASCPGIASLSLRGFKLHDNKVKLLLKGFRGLRYVDFSTSYSITGSFLRNTANHVSGSSLEVLVLRDCMHLKEVEVARFFLEIIAGEYQNLRHLDISNKEGLASEGDWDQRTYSSNMIPMKELIQVRPSLCVMAEFPSEGSFVDIDQMIEAELSDMSLPSPVSSPTSDESNFIGSMESSYNSDQGSGNEERDASYILYDESSDEVDILVI